MAKTARREKYADLKCPHCDSPLDLEWDDTETLHHDDDTTSVACPVCDKSFTVTMHLRSEFDASLPRPECKGCDWAEPSFDPKHATDQPKCYSSSDCPVSMI